MKNFTLRTGAKFSRDLISILRNAENGTVFCIEKNTDTKEELFTYGLLSETGDFWYEVKTENGEYSIYSEIELAELINDLSKGEKIEVYRDAYWYAVTSPIYLDWDRGSYEWNEALAIARAREEATEKGVEICKIDHPFKNAFCIDSWRLEEL